MNSEGNRVLLLVGSPKAPGKSVSEALGAYVIGKMKARGWSSESIFIRMSLQSDEGRAALLEAVKAADLIILSFPLYVDSLPAPVIRAMELIAEARFGKGHAFRRHCELRVPGNAAQQDSSSHLQTFRPHIGLGVGRRPCAGDGWSSFRSPTGRTRRDGRQDHQVTRSCCRCAREQ